jgi:hypothetical protein
VPAKKFYMKVDEGGVRNRNYRQILRRRHVVII